MAMEQARLELDRAIDARRNGKEGQSRVLARRAAGFAIREYLHTQGIDSQQYSLNDLLTIEEIRQHLTQSIIAALVHLNTRVDMYYALPPDLDLIEDTAAIIEQLSGRTGV